MKHFTFVFLFIAFTASAQQSRQWFKDPVDSAIDVSGFLNSAVGFLPVPIIITEPALGFGGGLAIAYLHNKKLRPGEERIGQLPPVISMIAGAYTSNKTYITMLVHQGSYKQDQFRYLGAIGYMSINMEYYGQGGGNLGAKYNMEGFLLFQEFLTRPKKESPFFTGFNYVFFTNEITFENTDSGTDSLSKETNLGGLNAVIMWDTRNNTFTPSSGLMTATEFGRFTKALGGDNDYWNFSNRTYYYLPIIIEQLFSGYRFNFESKWGPVPFYELPYVNLRGIPMRRYQDHLVLNIETEWRWQLYRRWSIIGFIGSGFTSDKLENFSLADGKVAAGFGGRYFLAKDYGLHAGIDFAKGPEQWAWYLTIGSNWFR